MDILTLFPSVFDSVFSQSIIKKAVDKKIAEIKITDIRNFAEGRHKTVDDKPYGGGAGMIMMAPPIVRAIEKVKGKRLKVKDQRIILLSPQGKIFNQKKAKELSKYKHLIFICGHYGGVDERVLKFVDEEISVGDFVLTGGEIPAMAVVDATVRMLPKVVAKSDSVKNDSHWAGGLASSVYTRPYNFRSLTVPEVLLSGNHQKIEKWRRQMSYKNTAKKRPDLLKNSKKLVEHT
ncbi:MAG: tRNA (guanosine(37)-N1)-methyltransferase TrmD [Elusimicrobia bacterium]|nr:tRNA (guanosine(37)-N1)-methyltransferase TrmD [Elusimicrobiota bacterium]